MENPVFPGLFDRARATVGGSIAAAKVALAGTIAFHPAGGTHHGRRDRASGFCYFNDPAYAIATFLDAGAVPVLYLDLDAHHGDGVELLFAGDSRVRLVSIHEEGRWPYSALGSGPANAINIPVPRALNDSELGWLMSEVVADEMHRTRPAAVVIVAGADCLYGDPLSAMALSNVAFWKAVTEATRWTPHSVVLGGGGYNPWTVARGWAGLWAVLSGREPAQPLTLASQALLHGFESDLIDSDEIEAEWLAAIADTPRPGLVRPQIRAFATTARPRG
jgi:acetoin utilization protein AcuC